MIATKGDVLQVDMRKELMQPSITRFHRISHNTEMQRVLTVIEADNSLSYIAVSGDEGIVSIYDTKEFTLIDIWRIEFGVTSLHSITNQEIGCIVAAGTVTGKIYILSYNGMEDYQLHCSNNKVTEVKISSNGEYLIAGAEDYNLYLYQLEEDKFMSVATRK